MEPPWLPVAEGGVWQAAPAASGPLGLLGIGLSWLGYGCGNAFVVLAKRRASGAGRPLHPVVATLLGSSAILVLGTPLGLLGPDLRFRWPSAYGLLGGALWAPGKLAIVLCTMGRGGMGVATATTSGSAVTSAFLAGLVVLGEPWRGPLAVLFIALMVVGIVGLTAARELTATNAELRGGEVGRCDEGHNTACEALQFTPSGCQAASSPATSTAHKAPLACELMICVGACALGGVGVGCSTLPLMFDPAKDNMAYLAGYCLGQFAAIGSAAALWYTGLRCRRRRGRNVDVAPMLVREAVLPMGCFGVLFVLGYLGSEFVAAAFGLSVGYPISQTSTVVAGLVSVALGEVRGSGPVVAFLLSCLAVVGGAVGLRLA